MNSITSPQANSTSPPACIRLKRGLCRLDLKPCKENCPLKKTKDEQDRKTQESELAIPMPYKSH